MSVLPKFPLRKDPAVLNDAMTILSKVSGILVWVLSLRFDVELLTRSSDSGTASTHWKHTEMGTL